MKQAFHIFRKDARRFAYQIGALAALTCMWAWSNIAAGRAGSAMAAASAGGRHNQYQENSPENCSLAHRHGLTLSG